MGSRIRDNPEHIFICFCEVVIPTSSDSQPWVLQKYPDDFNDEETLKTVPEFCYPCEFKNDAVQHFSFVLTSLDSKWTYGFCRHTPNQPTLFCFLSFLPWHETFYRLLNQVADLANDSRKSLHPLCMQINSETQTAPSEFLQCSGLLALFLNTLYTNPVPEPGTELHVTYNLKDFHTPCPNHLVLPSIPENRNLTEYFNAVDAHNMMVIFASMLHERRIIMTSRKLSRVSACVQAANSLIYPMHWQHIFIPVLPKHLLDYVSAPMPFLIGVPSVTMLQVKDSELGEVVVLNADTNQIHTPFKDFEALPTEILSMLKRPLKNHNMMLGDGLARAFMRALVRLIGGYREALKMTMGEKITFNEDAFIKTRPSSIQSFLETMLHLQIFQEFIEDRLEMLNSGTGFSDEFEQEVSLSEVNTSTRLRSQYKEWASTMKKEGGLFLKNVRSRVRDKGKRAYKDIRSKIQEMQKHPSQTDLRYKQKVSKPKSAPSSPTISRQKAFDFPPRMSYNQNASKKNPALDSNNLANSVSVSGFRRYKVLTIDEMSVASEDSCSDGEDTRGIQPINMDLMGDLQDILFRKCSTSSDGPSEATDNQKTSDMVPSSTGTLGFDDSFCDNSDVFLAAPMPPPRTKRKLPSSLQTTKLPLVRKNASENDDKPLIRLDSLDEVIFDPLIEAGLSKDRSTPSSQAQAPVNGIANLSKVSQQHPPRFLPNVALPPKQKCTISHHDGQGMKCFLSHGETKVESKDSRPPLPPKTGGSLLSKVDKDLLDDYGLSSSPIFRAIPFEDPVPHSSSTGKVSQSNVELTNDLLDLFKDDVKKSQGATSSRATWQKFI